MKRKAADLSAAAPRRDIDVCSSKHDAAGALAVFRQAAAAGQALPVHTYNVLLHLCAGGSGDGARTVHAEAATEVSTRPHINSHHAAADAAPAPTPGVRAPVQKRAGARRGDIHCARARGRRVRRRAQGLAAGAPTLPGTCCGDSDTHQVHDMRGRGLVPRLRTYSPALQAFCDADDLDSVRLCAAPYCRVSDERVRPTRRWRLKPKSGRPACR